MFLVGGETSLLTMDKKDPALFLSHQTYCGAGNGRGEPSKCSVSL